MTAFRPTKVVEPIQRKPVNHVIIIDGTRSSLEPGMETNAGLTFKLVSEMTAAVSVYYQPGLDWTKLGVLTGRGFNHQIRRAYGHLASHYRPGDKIFLIGFSRGAYAVRSLAGIIDRIGLLQANHALARNVRTAYRHYECMPDNDSARAFSSLYCHSHIDIEMIGVWDTVKSLGINAPVFWRLSVARNAFHNDNLGRTTKRGFHALARDETRVAYSPILWETDPDWPGHLEQVWFRGAHADVGGQVRDHEASRPLSNIPLVWMLEKAECCGMPLPDGWRDRYLQDAKAPATGTRSGLAGLLITRKRRTVCASPSESLHPSIAESAL